MLKRSRDDKTYSKNVLSELVPIKTTDAPPASAADQKHSQQKSPTRHPVSPKLLNPNYAKIVNNHLPVATAAAAVAGTTRNSQYQLRYPIKTLNGLRKVRPRSAVLAAARKKMPSRCLTPVAVAAATSAANAAANSITLNGSAAAAQNNKNGDIVVIDGDESDTGCSSLDDDDDFDGTHFSFFI